MGGAYKIASYYSGNNICQSRHSRTPIVIPAKAGIQSFRYLIDSRLRGNDKNIMRE